MLDSGGESLPTMGGKAGVAGTFEPYIRETDQTSAGWFKPASSWCELKARDIQDVNESVKPRWGRASLQS
jgi:hypothetical protein